MDHELATVFQAACYSAAAFGGIYALARYSFLKRESDNNTYVERMKAKQDLLSDPSYKEYLQRREDVSDKISQIDRYVDNDTLQGRIDAIVGDFSK